VHQNVGMNVWEHEYLEGMHILEYTIRFSLICLGHNNMQVGYKGIARKNFGIVFNFGFFHRFWAHFWAFTTGAESFQEGVESGKPPKYAHG